MRDSRRLTYSELLTRRAVARQRRTSPDVLVKLSGDEDELVRRSVARNPSSPPRALASLVSDPDRSVRVGVAANPSAPAAALGVLTSDWDASVRWSVAENPSAPPGVLRALSEDQDAGVRRVSTRARLRGVLRDSGAAALHEALGEDPPQWEEDRQRQALRELGEDA